MCTHGTANNVNDRQKKGSIVCVLNPEMTVSEYNSGEVEEHKLCVYFPTVIIFLFITKFLLSAPD